jgi:hypothetical protein
MLKVAANLADLSIVQFAEGQNKIADEAMQASSATIYAFAN